MRDKELPFSFVHFIEEKLYITKKLLGKLNDERKRPEVVVRRCSVKQVLLKFFQNLQKKNLRWSLFLIKSLFIKKRLLHRYFPQISKLKIASVTLVFKT